MDFANSALTRIAETIEQSVLSDTLGCQHAWDDRVGNATQGQGDTTRCAEHHDNAYGDPETKRKAIEGGATGLLTKPIDFTLLRSEIDSRLEPEPAG